MVYGDILHIDRDGRLLEVIRTGDLDVAHYLLNAFYLPQPSVFFRSFVPEQIGYFDTRFDLAMDKEYWTRLLFHFTWGYLPDVLAKARIYDEAKSVARKSGYLPEYLMILDEIFSDPSSFERAGIGVDREEFKREAYTSVYFSGSLLYLESREFIPAIRNIVKAAGVNPRLILARGLLLAAVLRTVGDKGIQESHQGVGGP
jgi:hypothetical protein